MARVQCPCGRIYTLPDERLGKRVKCAVCNRMFAAVALPPPSAKPAPPPQAKPVVPAGARRRLGEMAVARGLLPREQLNACLRYIETMRKLPGQEDLRLGAVLVSKRLLTQAQLAALLKEQGGGAGAAAAAAIDITPRRAPGQGPVTDEQREAVRRSMQAATQQLAEKEAAAAKAEAHPGLMDRIKPRHVGVGVCIILAALVATMLWPDPAAKRVLAAYLRSCDEVAVAPDASLAIGDLGLAIREVGNITLLPAARHDYAEDLAKFRQMGDQAGDDWWELLSSVEMPPEKQEALSLLLPAIPEELTPRKTDALEITVRPALCHMVFRQRGMGMYCGGQYRFYVLKARSPNWQCDWKVAGFELVSAAK